MTSEGHGMYHSNDDGSPTPAVPLGWQGNGIDWEIDRDASPRVAHAYDEDVLIAVVRARTWLGLNLRMLWAERRFGLRRNTVL